MQTVFNNAVLLLQGALCEGAINGGCCLSDIYQNVLDNNESDNVYEAADNIITNVFAKVITINDDDYYLTCKQCLQCLQQLTNALKNGTINDLILNNESN